MVKDISEQTIQNELSNNESPLNTGDFFAFIADLL